MEFDEYYIGSHLIIYLQTNKSETYAYSYNNHLEIICEKLTVKKTPKEIFLTAIRKFLDN